MRLKLYKVTGDSMLPDLPAGTFIVTLKRRHQAIRINDVVVAEHAVYGRIIKRVVDLAPDGTITLAGDNAAMSTTSETLGQIPRDRLLGQVIMRFRPAHKPSRRLRPVTR